jgi:hypothetical protein
MVPNGNLPTSPYPVAVKGRRSIHHPHLNAA